MAIKVLLADDSKDGRQAIKTLFEYYPGMNVVGEAENLDEAVLKSFELRPDVVVLDLRLAAGGITPQQRDFISKAKLVAITVGADASSNTLAQNIGARELVDKSDLSRTLIPTILRLARTKTAGAG